MSKKPSKQLKDQCQVLLDTLAEYNADYRCILRDLDYIQQVVMEGMQQEKVSAKDGVLTVNEKYPNIALDCLKTKMKLIQDIDKYQASSEDEVDYTININITPLEDLVK